MSIRVVARVRPLLESERQSDVIVRTGSAARSSPARRSLPNSKRKLDAGSNDCENIIKIPSQRSEAEEFSFQFNAVYDSNSTQQELFDAEVAPTIKHLFAGRDVTIFAYGVTGTGKTHTMRGGESLEQRGVIPRLLNGIYRRSKKLESDDENVNVQVLMSYYEIYNDKVFDLFEPPEKRSPMGLPLRDAGGKTTVVGLTEKPCNNLRSFEELYDQGNENRSTGATKLNAHSSRSHAILRVKLVVSNGETSRTSVASAIDLAGSEDNRRTENGKERMVESSSINKSLFVLAQCVEAISKKHARIPYRESKMTRILSLGQNKGHTLMILNLSPIRSYHLDTLSSLNFANRTKRIEVREEVANPVVKANPQMKRPGTPASKQFNKAKTPSPKASKIGQTPGQANRGKVTKPTANTSKQTAKANNEPPRRRSSTTKLPMPSDRRKSGVPQSSPAGPIKPPRKSEMPNIENPASRVEALIERKVEAVLAAHQREAAAETERLRRRVRELERRLEDVEGERAQGVSFLLQGKQLQARGEDSAALCSYQMAAPFFPNNVKLQNKIKMLRWKLGRAEPQQPLVQSIDDDDESVYSREADGMQYANGQNADIDAVESLIQELGRGASEDITTYADSMGHEVF